MTHSIQYYEQAFRTLHTNMQHGKPAPHKAFLLLAVIDMIEEGVVTSTHINLTEELEARFNKLWKRLLGKSAYFSPDVFKPYYHMEHESFWKLIAQDNINKEEAVKPNYTRRWMRERYKYAVIDDELFALLQDETVRARLRVVLISTYLTDQPVKVSIIDGADKTGLVLISLLLGMMVA